MNDISTVESRTETAAAINDLRMSQIRHVRYERSQGKSYSLIARQMGMAESSVRSLFDDTDHIPIEIVSQETREDGIHVVGRVPSNVFLESDEDLSLPENVDRSAINDRMVREDMSIRMREEDSSKVMKEKKTEDILAGDKQSAERVNHKALARALAGSTFKTTPHRGPSRDRSLSGKARRKARKAG